jgi:hypothetical protein
LVEAVFFTLRVSVYFNRMDILYEISAAPFAAAARERFKPWRLVICVSASRRMKWQIARAVFEEMR